MMASEELLTELEGALTHFFCAGVEDDSRRNSMESAVKDYVRKEVVRFSDDEVLQMFYSQENAVTLFFEHLARLGKVRVRDDLMNPANTLQ
jgi:hypothetical protein